MIEYTDPDETYEKTSKDQANIYLDENYKSITDKKPLIIGSEVYTTCENESMHIKNIIKNNKITGRVYKGNHLDVN